jgi:hypothetical protein
MRNLTRDELDMVVDAIKAFDAATGSQARGLWWTVRRASILSHPPRNSWRIDLRADARPFIASLRNAIQTSPSLNFVQTDDESLGQVVDALINIVRERDAQERAKLRVFTAQEVALAIELFKATKPGIWEKLKFCQSQDAGGHGTEEFWEVRQSMARVELTLPMFTEAERKSLGPSRLLGKIVEAAQNELELR